MQGGEEQMGIELRFRCAATLHQPDEGVPQVGGSAQPVLLAQRRPVEAPLCHQPIDVGVVEGEVEDGVVVDDRGRILVADRENARIQVFDDGGAVLAVWDDPRLGRPWALALHGAHVFVLDGGDQDPEHPRTRVIELDGEGRVLSTFDARATEPAAIQTGHGIAVGRDGSVYVADLEGERIVKLVRR